jgi:type IV secretion system protein VirB2
MFFMTTTSTKKASLSFSWQLCFAALASVVVMALPDLANAAAGDAFGGIMCTVASWFTGRTGKGLATIGITIIGIGALLGKVSWGMALIVGIGVAIVFGAASIVDEIAAASDSTNTATCD